MISITSVILYGSSEAYYENYDIEMNVNGVCMCNMEVTNVLEMLHLEYILPCTSSSEKTVKALHMYCVSSVCITHEVCGCVSGGTFIVM